MIYEFTTKLETDQQRAGTGILTANLAMIFAPAPSPKPTTFFTLK